MNHLIIYIKSVSVVSSGVIQVEFDNGVSKEIDLRPLMQGQMYSPLAEFDFFKQVKIDPESKTIVWPNGADFDPETLYNWDSVRDELAERAKNWR